MNTITTTDITRKPSIITSTKSITLIEDGRNHQPKSVLLPYDFYLKIREKIEDELYLQENAAALSTSYDEPEDVIGELS